MANNKYIDFILGITQQTKDKKLNWRYLDTNKALYEGMGWVNTKTEFALFSGGKEVSTPSGVAEHTVECTISGSYKLNNNLSFNGAVLNRMQWNYHNIKGETKYSIQTSFGLRWIIL